MQMVSWKMRYFSICTGIGGFELGIETATSGKWECVGYSEIDKYAIQTFQKHYPKLKNYGDATKINPTELPDFDILCGGFPCQSFSIAGKRRGFLDTRGTIFFDIARIAKAKRPRLLFLENVKGLLNHNRGDTFKVILQTLDELGYNAEWQVLNSKYFGVPQNRERVFIIGHLRGESSRQIFPITKPQGMDESMAKQTKIIKAQNSGREMARIYDVKGIAPTLRVPSGGWHSPMIKLGNIYPSGGQAGNIYDTQGISPALTPAKRGGSRAMPLVMNTLTEALGTRAGSSKEFTRSVEKIEQATGKIRRITPLECERLQGFPDGWTEGVSDTQRYRQLGNAVTVNVIEEITKRIETGGL